MFLQFRQAVGKEAGKAGCFTRQDVHGDSVGANGGSINPGNVLLDGVIVQQVTRLEVVGGIENEICAMQQFADIGRNHICNMR